MLNIGLMGAWHVHFKGYATAAAAREDCRITALWDPDAGRGQKAAEAFGCEWNVDSDYPGMEYNPDSEMRKTYAKLVKEIFDAELTESGTHGGMEIGYFATTIPGVDIVTHACVCSGAHTPNEKMKLESFNKSYGILVKFLEMLP